MANENAGTPGASGTETPNPNPAAVTPPAGEGNPLGEAAAKAAAERAWIPEALRTHKSLTKFKEPGDVAQAYVNLETKLGQRVAPPADDAAPEVKAAWRKSIGVPDDKSAYGKPAIPEGSELQLDEGYIGAFHDVAHEIGLTGPQAQRLMNWVVAREVSQFTDMKAAGERAQTEGMKTLRANWGAATEENVGLIQRLVAETADDKIKAAMDRTGFGNDPEGLRWMAKLARQMADHDMIDPKLARTSQQEAQAKIDSIKAAAAADRKHPWRDASNPGHKAAVDEMNALYQIANPEVEFNVNV